MTVAYYTSDSPCRRCNGTQRYRSPPSHKGKCACCVTCEEAERKARKWVVGADLPLTPDDEDPEDEMLVEGWDG